MMGFTLPANAACPECGNSNVVGVVWKGRRLGGCGQCKSFWEPLPADAPADVGVTPQPFRKSCDNCAFHQNSPERSDPEKWKGLVMSMGMQEKPFYCHKGVALQIEGDGYPAEHGFRYPLTSEGHPDQQRLRVCAGFIKWWHDMCGGPVPGMPHTDGDLEE